MISYDDFSKIELRIAKILAAERVQGSEKLLQLRVSLGSEERQIIAGIGKAYDPATLIGREIAIVVNLEPRKLMGLESQGMLLAASAPETEGIVSLPVLLMPDKEVPPGSTIR
jgi:methionine--tRNA ligase beta chain